jgi:hypothetical protein
MQSPDHSPSRQKAITGSGQSNIKELLFVNHIDCKILIASVSTYMIYSLQHYEDDGTKLLSASSQPLLGTTITCQFVIFNSHSSSYEEYLPCIEC